MNPYKDDVRDNIAKGDAFVDWFVGIMKQFMGFFDRIKALFESLK